MSFIVPRKPTFGERIGEGLGSGFSQGLGQALQHMLQQEGKGGDMKAAEKLASLEGGLSTVQRLRELGEEGNLGIGTKLRSVFDPKTAKSAGEYKQLGKSLISLASTIPIRNKAEFETLAADLYNPSLRDAEREGILDSMEKIISDSLGAYSGSKKRKKMKFDPENPEHVERVNAVRKKYKGDEEKAHKFLLGEFEI